ncbi:MAG TPA: hypothetical protein VI916_14510 [Acidimicrobiia bacterium]|nr:hypothetical protein [Acidimicrobiia bacterium]
MADGVMRAGVGLLLAVGVALAVPTPVPAGSSVPGRLVIDDPAILVGLTDVGEHGAVNPFTGEPLPPDERPFESLAPRRFGQFTIEGASATAPLLTCGDGTIFCSEELAEAEAPESLRVFAVTFDGTAPSPPPPIVGVNLNFDMRPGDVAGFAGPTPAECGAGLQIVNGDPFPSTSVFDPVAGEFVEVPAPLGFSMSPGGAVVFFPPGHPCDNATGIQVGGFAGDPPGFFEYSSPPPGDAYFPFDPGVIGAPSEPDAPPGGAANVDRSEPASGAPNSDDDGGVGLGFPLLIGAGAGLLGGGVYLWTKGGSAPARDAGDDFMDAFTGAFGGTGTTETRSDEASDAALVTAQQHEDGIQARIESEHARLTKDLAAAIAAYLAATDEYQSKFALVSSASTELEGLLTAWKESRAIAQQADIAFAVATLLWSGGSLGLRAVRWIRTPGTAAAGVADDALDAGTAVKAGDTVVGSAWAEAPTVVERVGGAGETAATVVERAGSAVKGVDDVLLL